MSNKTDPPVTASGNEPVKSDAESPPPVTVSKLVDMGIPPGVIVRTDGFFGVEGLPDHVYYSSIAVAARVALALKPQP